MIYILLGKITQMKKTILACTLLFFVQSILIGQTKPIGTQLVLLGTGTPFANPDRSGPALAIVVNNVSYVVDCGPGVVRRAAAASAKGIKALEASQLKKLFITHLHSDHTSGYADFIFTPAVLDRNEPLEVFGPKGLKLMTKHLLAAYKEDMAIRIHGLEMGVAAGYRVNVHEVSNGIIYQDSNMVVKTFKVQHGGWPVSLGYRFETADKIIVVSGDCTYSESLIENAKGCDILVHEVYAEAALAKREKRWQDYHSTFHTSSSQVAAIANQVQPKLLVLTHQLTFSATLATLLAEVQKGYKGAVVNGNDLDVF